MTPFNDDNPDAILPISLCRLTPQGVASLIHHLRQHPAFANLPEERLRAMAFAFLAHGGTNDNNHAVNPGSFHHIHYETHRASRAGTWRNNMREDYLGLVMDLVTWLDRLSGGSTVLIHSPGTRPPGTWALTEEARLDVFLPYVLHREQPTLRAVFAYLVQYFAQYVATATMERWDRGKGLHHGGPLDNPGLLRSTSNRGLSQPLIPESATPRHVFYGRRTGVVDLLVSAEGLTQYPLPTLLLPAPAPSARSPTSTQTPPSKPNPKHTASCEGKIKSKSSSGKPPQNLQFSDDGSWTKVDATACTECSVSELAPSDSASQQQVARTAVSSGDLITDLVSHVQQLERKTILQNAKIVRLRNRYEPEFDDDDEDAPQLLPPRRSDRRRSDRRPDHSSSDGDSSTCGKGKAPARGSSSRSCLSLSESIAFSPSSTVCDPPSLSTPSGETSSSQHVSVRDQSSYTSVRMNEAGGRTGQQSSSSLAVPSSSGAARASGSSPIRPGTPSPTQALSPQVRPFGTITDHVVNYYNLAPQTHGSLRRVLQDYEREDWAIGIATYLPDISDTIADELLEAMRQDLPLD